MCSDIAEQLREFYEAHRGELYTYAVALTRNRAAAEDAIHTAFEHLLRRGWTPSDLRPYVFRCVRNAAVDGRRNGIPALDGLFAEPTGAPEGPDAVRSREVGALLERLGDDEREAIVLKVFDALTFREIAAVRGVSLHTAASWYRRGLDKLRAMLQEDAPHER